MGGRLQLVEGRADPRGARVSHCCRAEPTQLAGRRRRGDETHRQSGRPRSPRRSPYGGTVITAAGDDPKVAALVDVAAFAPDLGPSTFDAGAGFPAPALAEIRADQLGFLTWTPTGIR